MNQSQGAAGERNRISQIRGKLIRAFDSDVFVCAIEYTDQDGKVTQRTISPMRFEGREDVLALCLGREEPRRFKLASIGGVKLIPANEAVMPDEVKEITK